MTEQSWAAHGQLILVPSMLLLNAFYFVLRLTGDVCRWDQVIDWMLCKPWQFKASAVKGFQSLFYHFH